MSLLSLRYNSKHFPRSFYWLTHVFFVWRQNIFAVLNFAAQGWISCGPSEACCRRINDVFVSPGQRLTTIVLIQRWIKQLLKAFYSFFFSEILTTRSIRTRWSKKASELALTKLHYYSCAAKTSWLEFLLLCLVRLFFFFFLEDCSYVPFRNCKKKEDIIM